jgi:hypothetical protein
VNINPIIVELLRSGIKVELFIRKIEKPEVFEGNLEDYPEEILWYRITDIPKTGSIDFNEIPSGDLVSCARYNRIAQVHSVEDIVYEVFGWWDSYGEESAPPQGWGPLFEKYNLAKAKTKTVWVKTSS